MTQDEFIARVLLVFHPIEEATVVVYYERYHGITAYGMGVMIYENNQVDIRYDLDSPGFERWGHVKGPLAFAEAWEFITAFINEYPDK